MYCAPVAPWNVNVSALITKKVASCSHVAVILSHEAGKHAVPY